MVKGGEIRRGGDLSGENYALAWITPPGDVE